MTGPEPFDSWLRDAESPRAAAALDQVLAFGRAAPGFAYMWAAAVSAAADQCTAAVLHAQAAGNAEGAVRVDLSDMMVPAPAGMSREDVVAALGCAAVREAGARLDRMTPPGASG